MLSLGVPVIKESANAIQVAAHDATVNKELIHFIANSIGAAGVGFLVHLANDSVIGNV